MHDGKSILRGLKNKGQILGSICPSYHSYHKQIADISVIKSFYKKKSNHITALVNDMNEKFREK